MSLKQQCQQLKDELYKLKKKPIPETKQQPVHKELDQIMFGKNQNAETPSPKAKVIPHYQIRIREYSPEEYEPRSTTNSEKALVYNRNSIRNEIKEIQNIISAPPDYVCFSNKAKGEISEDLEKTRKITQPIKKLEEDENFELKRTVLLMSKTSKSNPLNKNFAETCNKIYNERKGTSNLKVRELIKQTKGNTE